MFRSDIKDRKAEYNEASNNADKKTGSGALVTASAKNNALMPKSSSNSKEDDDIVDTGKIASNVVSMWKDQANELSGEPSGGDDQDSPSDLFGGAPGSSSGSGSGGSSSGGSPIP